MCLAIPMRLIERDGAVGTVMLETVTRRVNLLLVPEVKPGDYVIIHAGCAIEILDEAEAEKTISFFKDFSIHD
jgi:hydrogenase expression/formation protein HypC